ncbi:MAG: hypothetical protein ACSHX3_15740 [Litorimonas sp.]
MTDVIAWPPFGITKWELAELYPQSRSVGLIGGRARTSSALRSRRVATASVRGIGPDMAGAGYVRMLNRLWGGRPRLVRVTCLPTLWFRARGNLDLSNTVLEWSAGNDDLLWSVDSDDLDWFYGSYPLQGVPMADGMWHGLEVTGLPPNTLVARPSDVIKVGVGDADPQSAYCLSVVRSDADGMALVRTDRAEAFTASGVVSIGEAEVITFETIDVPRSVQGLSSDFEYAWEFREVFEDEYSDGFTVVDPWS